MNLVKAVDAKSTQALWVEITDLDGELVSGGKGKPKDKLVVRVEIEDSNVLIARGNITFGENAF